MKKFIFALFFLIVVSPMFVNAQDSSTITGAEWRMWGKNFLNNRWDNNNFTSQDTYILSNSLSLSVRSTPAISNDYIYALRDNGFFNPATLYQLDPYDLSVLNSFDLSVHSTMSPIVAGGYVYIGDRLGNMYQLDANNISQVSATFSFSSLDTFFEAIVYNGFLYVGSDSNGRVYQLNASNIAQKISNITLVGSVRTLAGANGYLYVPTDGNMYQLDANNISNIINSKYVYGCGFGDGFDSTLNTHDCYPVVYDGNIYMSSNGAGVKIDAFNITDVKQNTTGTFGEVFLIGSPIIQDGFAYFTQDHLFSNRGIIRKYNLSNMNQSVQSWETPAGLRSVLVSSPTTDDGNYLYVKGGRNSRIYVVDKRTLSLYNYVDLSSTNTTGFVRSSPLLVDNYLYVVSNDGILFKISTDYLLNNIRFSNPTPSDNSFNYQGSFSINTSVFNLSSVQMKNLTNYLYTPAGSLAVSDSVFSINGTNRLELFSTLSGLSVGVWKYNATAIDDIGFTVNTETRSIIISNVQYSTGTESDNSVLTTRNNTYIHAVAENISSSLIYNMTFNLYNSVGSLINNFTFNLLSPSDYLESDINFTNLPNGVYRFNVTTMNDLGQVAFTPTRTITINNPSCTESWISNNTICNGVNYTIKYYDSNSCGTYVNLPVNNGSVISCGCSESWSVQYTTCVNNSRIRYYTDSNSCGTYLNLPVNNNTIVSCGCVESWSPYFTACNNGFRFKYYVDSNSCNTYLNLPVDNGGQFACTVVQNNINNVYVNGSASYFGYYRIGVDVNASTTIFVNLTYPNGSITTFNTTLIGDDYFTDLIYGVPNGTYTMTAINGSESYSKSFIISDNQSIVPSSYLSVVPAGQNFSFNLSIYSNVALNYSAVCSVPSGFECIIPANISTDGFNSTPIIIVSNVSLSEGSYSGSINITRLIDNRVVTIPLTLGISNVFGIPEIQNISNFLSVIYDTGTSSKSYIVKNVGSYPLSMCNVVFDGDLANKGFISKSPTNFNLSVNDSVSFTITYTTPQTGTYQGYLDVICTATADNQSNGLVSRPFHQIIVNTFTQSAGSGGGGGGGSQGAVVVSAGNRSLFVIESDSGATFTAKYIYPSQSRTQTFIIRSLIAEDQALTISCSGNFCPNVKFSRDSILLRGFSQEFITATITAPTNVDYDVTFFYSVVVSDSFQHSGEVSNQVIVSKIAYWYSKFNPVTSPEEASYWTSLGGTDLPKILLYFLLVLIADVLVFVIYPDGKSRSENLLLVLLVTSVIVFIGASFIY